MHPRTRTSSFVASAIGVALTVLSVMCGCHSARAVEHPVASIEDTFITRAAFSDGRLWLLSSRGALTRITPGEHTRIDAGLNMHLSDLCVRDGTLVWLRCIEDDDEGCARWTVNEFDHDRPLLRGSVTRATNEWLTGLACTDDETLLVTTQRVVSFGAAGARTQMLARPVGPGTASALYATATQIYVGFNLGEWGGGLGRIDRQTGHVDPVVRSERGDVCSGISNAGCVGINGIAVEPWNPNCIVAAEGMVHFVASGKLIELCGGNVKEIYSLPFGKAFPHPNPRGPLRQTMAFFGLRRVGDALWATGLDGIYRVTKDGTSPLPTQPTFETIGKLAVSFSDPDVVIVSTDIQRRLSMSGTSLLLVSRH